MGNSIRILQVLQVYNYLTCVQFSAFSLLALQSKTRAFDTFFALFNFGRFWQERVVRPVGTLDYSKTTEQPGKVSIFNRD